MRRFFKISFRDEWNPLIMEKCFIYPDGRIIKTEDHSKYAIDYVGKNYPGNEQYGDPVERLINDGWIKIDINSATLLKNKMRQLKFFLIQTHADQESEIKLYLLDGSGNKHEKNVIIKDIINKGELND